MTARWRRILQAAAALVVGGPMLLAVALDQAAQSDPEAPDCGAMQAEALNAWAAYPPRTAFLAAQNPPPSARVEGWVIGDCAGGACVVRSEACGELYRYEYAVAGPHNGWYIVRVRAPRYFLKGLKAWADATPEAQWIGGTREFATACLTRFTAAQCRSLYNTLEGCWERQDGYLCRTFGDGTFGLYGPGVGGTEACVPGPGDRPVPCVTNGSDEDIALDVEQE